jgi:hypothetical protein
MTEEDAAREYAVSAGPLLVRVTGLSLSGTPGDNMLAVSQASLADSAAVYGVEPARCCEQLRPSRVSASTTRPISSHGDKTSSSYAWVCGDGGPIHSECIDRASTARDWLFDQSLGRLNPNSWWNCPVLDAAVVSSTFCAAVCTRLLDSF